MHIFCNTFAIFDFTLFDNFFDRSLFATKGYPKNDPTLITIIHQNVHISNLLKMDHRRVINQYFTFDFKTFIWDVGVDPNFFEWGLIPTHRKSMCPNLWDRFAARTPNQNITYTNPQPHQKP